ncbi:MAG: metallophosphoesterase family protein [Opitutae bacterium]|nr:metallophosphoesterase family protein [Opitutae bacterium]
MLRILSDLHLHDARSEVRALRQLEPLLAGVRTLVLNGDTCEMRRGLSRAQVEELKNFFRARVPEVVFVTGNHDPDISDAHEYLAADGRVWVVHGDVCFDDLTPWSRHVAEIRRYVAAQLASDPRADYSRLDVRFRIARHVARTETNVPDLVTRTWLSHFGWFWRTFFPPTQVLAMLRCWRDLPQRARALARAQRPTAQVVVTGHVHFPGVWRTNGGPTVINTGSFFRPLGGNLVDVTDDKVRVRRIEQECGEFRTGNLIAEIALR